MFVYTIGDIVNFIIFALLALVLIIVEVLDKKDDKDGEKAENITVKNMLGRLFAKRVQNPKIIGMAANGKNLIQGGCPRCGIILDSSYKRCPKCWQKLRWENGRTC